MQNALSFSLNLNPISHWLFSDNMKICFGVNFIYGLSELLFLPEHSGAGVVDGDSTVEVFLAVLLAEGKSVQ